MPAIAPVDATLNGAIDVSTGRRGYDDCTDYRQRKGHGARNTILHAMHDVGLAAWFGGTLANAISLNPGRRRRGRFQKQRARSRTSAGTAGLLSTPRRSACIIGSAVMMGANLRRLKAQRGVAAMSLAKTALTAAGLGATAYSRALGTKVSKHDDVPAETGTEPGALTHPDAATAQRQLSMLQWAIPALTGAIEVVSAYASEQQRATEVHKGMLSRLIR